MNQEVIKRNLEDIKYSDFKMERIISNIYANVDNIFSDVLVVQEGKGLYVHCMKHCIKGTGCVLYETVLNNIPSLITKEFIWNLELKPIYVSKKALISINVLREASGYLKDKSEILKGAADAIIKKMNEGLFI
jgi:hypothetical protein